MSDPLAEHLDRVYHASSPADLGRAYDLWAPTYDRDMDDDLGWGAPTEAARALAALLRRDDPVLDVGAGTGLMGQALADLGFARLAAADLSEGMLEVARRRGIYGRLHRVDSLGPLPFAAGEFAAVVAVGVLTEGHAPAACLRDWVRVTRPGGYVAFTLRPDLAEPLGYRAEFDAVTAEGLWAPVLESPDLQGFRRLQSRPYRLHVFQVRQDRRSRSNAPASG